MVTSKNHMQSRCDSDRARIRRDGKSCCEFHHNKFKELMYDCEHMGEMEFLMKHDMVIGLVKDMHKESINKIKDSDDGIFWIDYKISRLNL